ncbi:MAG: hypothetical protein WAL25_09735 [Acidimicrobiia bacterium]
MTVEQRLTEALAEADRVQPSIDLFARVSTSIAEDRARRRRRISVIAGVVAFAGLIAVYLWWAADVTTAGVVIDGWEMVLAQLTISVALLIAIGPNIRRFAASFVDDVFHLSPATGSRFLAVLDVAYYVAFTGLILVGAGDWGLDATLGFGRALTDAVTRLATFMMTMGILHALNIAVLPVIGLIFNSMARADLRRRAGDAAPPASLRARKADGNARGFAVAAVVIAVSLLALLIVGPIGGWVLNLLDQVN